MKRCTGRNCIMQYDKVDPATCQAVTYCPQATPPKTNADRIRAMSDEELAEWLRNIRYSCTCVPRDNGNRCADFKDDCKACWLEWLRQERFDRRAGGTVSVKIKDLEFVQKCKCGGTLSEIRYHNGRPYVHCYSCHFEFYLEDEDENKT